MRVYVSYLRTRAAFILMYALASPWISSCFLVRLILNMQEAVRTYPLVSTDGTTSVSEEEFRYQTTFATSIFSTLSVAPGHVHVALVEYSEFPTAIYGDASFFVDSAARATGLANSAVPSLRGTAAGRALAYVAEKISINGRPGVPSAVVFLMDGSSQDDVREGAEALHALGTTVYAIGLGPSANFEQLEIIAGTDSGSLLQPSVAFDQFDGALVTDNLVADLCSSETQEECTKCRNR